MITSKNKPPVAGAISWARSIFYRIKRPILKFLSREETFIPKEDTRENKELFTLFSNVKNEYKTLAKKLD